VKPAAAGPRAVHFEIGRLTLHGFSAGQERRFVSSLQSSLAELGASGGDWPAAGRRTIGHLDAGALRSGASPEEAAHAVVTQIRAAVKGKRGEAR
jgi:hypothetical protein